MEPPLLNWRWSTLLGIWHLLFSMNKARVATWVGIGLYAIGSLAYSILGQYNGDEGWYLYTSRLVFLGELPYRDFAYTQMPLLPYIYGVLQIVQPSLFLGRLTGVLISVGTLSMGIVIARRSGGGRAAGIAALLFAAFGLGLYFNTIVKTYALVSFFFMATMFVLSSSLRDTSKYPLALLYAFGSAMVRVSALLFVAPVWLYVLIAAPSRRTRVILLLETAAVGLSAAFFLLPEWATARWDLFDSHLRHWNNAPALTVFIRILTERLPDVVQNFGPALLLFAASLYFLALDKETKPFLWHRLPVLISALGLTLFAAAHLVNGIWAVEYLVPAMTAFLPMLAIGLSRVYEQQSRQSRGFVQGTLVAALLLLPMTESIQHIDFSGRRLPLSEIGQVAAYVATHSQPDDRIFALEALGVAVEANRSALPGMNLAQFSLQLVDNPTAQRLHVVNADMLVDSLSEASATVVLLTENDWSMITLLNPGSVAALKDALDSRYELALTVPQFGQFARILYVYVKR